jgi:hypothetical protein
MNMIQWPFLCAVNANITKTLTQMIASAPPNTGHMPSPFVGPRDCGRFETSAVKDVTPATASAGRDEARRGRRP